MNGTSASHDKGMPHDEDAGATALDGGVSSDIRIVHSAHGDYVVKRALAKLKVEADWFSDPARSSIEVRGLRTIAALLGAAHAPNILWADEANHRFAMTLVAARFRNWKQLLLQGTIDLETARSAGRLLGQLHVRSSHDAVIAQEFADNRIFIELRVRPFFERIAQRNPALAPAIEAVIANLHRHRNAFVHGDYSPKNLLVDGADIVILDCEVAHWGDARFDVAFCLAHLLLKSFRRAAPAPLLQAAARVFYSEYRRCGLPILDAHFVQQLGCLLLARLEGDSPVDYRHDLDGPTVKAFAAELIAFPSDRALDSLTEFLT